MGTAAALLTAPALAACSRQDSGPARTEAASAVAFQSDWNGRYATTSASTVSTAAATSAAPTSPDAGATTRADIATAIGLGTARQRGLDGAGVDVALIDTGVAPVAGLDTAGAVVNGPDLSLDYQAGLPSAVDAYGHGTHLAGIIAGRDGGVAPGARILNVKVGAGDGAVDVSQVIAGIDWVVQHRKDPGMNVKVLALAYGTDSTQGYTSSPLTHAVESAWRNGITVVVSAGNSGNSGALVNPATDPFVIAVGAANIGDPTKESDDTLATFSAKGTSSRAVDLVAPGTSIVSSRLPGGMVDTLYPESRTTDGQYTKGSGTSQAAAVVAGAAAILQQQRPTATPDQIKAALRAGASTLSSVSYAAQGRGELDLGNALSKWDSGSATQKWTKSTGTGSIEAARGTSHLAADDGSQLTGEVDVQGAPWDGAAWAPLSTAGTTWTGGTYNGNDWAGTDWNTDLTVDGVAWTGRTWRASTWSGRTWRADLWAGRTWRADLWAGRTWRVTGWV